MQSLVTEQSSNRQILETVPKPRLHSQCPLITGTYQTYLNTLIHLGFFIWEGKNVMLLLLVSKQNPMLYLVRENY